MTTDPLDCPWRIGRKLGRTIYAVVEGEESRDHDVLLGMVDDKAIATHIVEIHNADLAPAQRSAVVMSLLRRTRPHQVPAPLIALDQSLREAPVDERRKADTLARARQTLMSIERLNTGRRWWPTLWFFYCPYCQEWGPDRVRRRRAVADREAHHCTAGKP